jgi:hypothetical protein
VKPHQASSERRPEKTAQPERQATIDDGSVPAAAWAHSVSRSELSESRGDRLSYSPAPRPAGNVAGVVPVLQALRRTVADHRDGYATLQRRALLTLIHLLQVLGGPACPPGCGRYIRRRICPKRQSPIRTELRRLSASAARRP